MAIANLRNGSGWLIITEASGTAVRQVYKNNDLGWQQVLDWVEQALLVPEILPDTNNHYDTDTGFRIWLDTILDNTNFLTRPLTYSTAINEITKYALNPGIYHQHNWLEVEIDTGEVEFDRMTNITFLQVETQSGAGTDSLVTITSNGVLKGDIIFLMLDNESHVVTVEQGVTVGNIELRDAEADEIDSFEKVLMLIYTGSVWREFSRNVNVDTLPTVANLRLQGVSMPATGYATTTVPTSGTKTLVAGTDKEHQRFVGGPTTLVAGYNVTASGGIEGDHFWVFIDSGTTIGANAFTVFGETITANEALNGGIVVYGYYNGSAWAGRKLYDGDALDWIVTAMIAPDAITQTELANDSVGLDQIKDSEIVPVLEFTLTIASADILTLNSTPIELVAAPGASKIIDLLTAEVFLDYGGVAYATQTNVAIKHNGATENIALATAILAATADRRAQMSRVAWSSGTQQLDNTSLVAFVPTADPTAGTGTITISGTYRVRTLT